MMTWGRGISANLLGFFAEITTDHLALQREDQGDVREHAQGLISRTFGCQHKHYGWPQLAADRRSYVHCLSGCGMRREYALGTKGWKFMGQWESDPVTK